jgi:hypothetical protein
MTVLTPQLVTYLCYRWKTLVFYYNNWKRIFFLEVLIYMYGIVLQTLFIEKFCL